MEQVHILTQQEFQQDSQAQDNEIYLAKSVSLLNSQSGQTIFTFDACMDENYGATAELTEFPVESGATISDHVYNKPDRVTLHGIVSNYPLFGKIDDTRASRAYNLLNGLKADKVLVDVVGGLTSYEQMAIVSVAAPRSVQNGNALDITLELKQVNFVNTSTLLMKNPVVKKTAKKSNLGTQTPQQVQPFQGAIDWVVSFGKSVLGVK
jgi:hypothetical protein